MTEEIYGDKRVGTKTLPRSPFWKSRRVLGARGESRSPLEELINKAPPPKFHFPFQSPKMP